MKTISLLLILTSARCIAQVDSTRTHTTPAEGAARQQAAAPREDGHIQWKHIEDGRQEGDPDTILVETGRKLIQIVIIPRLDEGVKDAATEQLARARIVRRRTFTHWCGFDVGVNTFIAPDGRLGDGPQAGPFLLRNMRSRWVSINFMERKHEFGTHRSGLFWGLGLEFTGYHLSENATLAYNGDSIYALTADQPQFTKNKLRQIGLRVPLMFEFNTKKAPLPATTEEWKRYHEHGFSQEDNLHFAAGLVGSWYFDTMYKQKFREGGENRKIRDKGGYNMLPYRLAARVQFGAGYWSLFAEYGLTPLFVRGTAPELTPVTIGLNLGLN